MGCSCNRKTEEQYEMKNGNLPEEDNIDLDEDKHNDNINDNNLNINTDVLTKNQDRNNQLFNYFNELRSSPQNFMSEAEKYDLQDIITLAETKKNSISINTLIKNPFYNLYFDNYIQKYPFCKEDIMNSLDNNEQLNMYQKFLYSSEGTNENPNECIWNLIKENKDIAVDEILYKNIDYFIISSIYIPDNKKIIAYFLLLKKN